MWCIYVWVSWCHTFSYACPISMLLRWGIKFVDKGLICKWKVNMVQDLADLKLVTCKTLRERRKTGHGD